MNKYFTTTTTTNETNIYSWFKAPVLGRSPEYCPNAAAAVACSHNEFQIRSSDTSNLQMECVRDVTDEQVNADSLKYNIFIFF